MWNRIVYGICHHKIFEAELKMRGYIVGVSQKEVIQLRREMAEESKFAYARELGRGKLNNRFSSRNPDLPLALNDQRQCM